MRRFGQFMRELRRRRVFRTVGFYIVGAWVLMQVIALAFQSFGIPDSAMRFIWLAAIAGFPLAIIFGWRYDITPEGIVRTPPASISESTDVSLRRPDFIILIALTIVAVVFIGSTINEIRQGPLRGAGPWYATDHLATAIAVLPLENLSPGGGQRFLAAGLHDALITTLSRISRFRVTSRFSSQRVTEGLAFPEIGRLLRVDKILFGSVMRDGDQIRVNVTLADAATEQPLWTDSFTREFDGLISMQNEVASAVAREVKVQLTPVEEKHLSQTDSSESATYEAYLKGMFQLHKGSPKGYRRAIEIFTEAVEENPTSALAYAGLAIGYSQLGHSPYPIAGAYPRAQEAAQRAIEFEPDLAEAHLAVAMYKMYYEWDFAGAEEAFLHALELNPSLVDAHYHYAWLLELLLRDEEAIKYGEYTKELNPLSPFYTAWLADQYRDAGMFEKAITEAKTTLELNPDYPVAWLTLGQTYLDMGRVDEAIEAHEHLRGNRFWAFVLAATLAAADRNEMAAEVLRFVEEEDNNPLTLTLIYAGYGDREEALKWMQAARDQKIPWFPWLVTWYPQTKNLHDDPIMQEFAAELGIEFPY